MLLFLVIAGAAFAYTTHHFAIDTDTVKLFPPDLPWRQHQAAFDQAFPMKADQIAVVVDALTPELAEQATASLTARLQQDPKLFPVVYRPDGGTFFQRNGLLFLPTADVKHLTDQLIAAQPLLGPLAADPSLRGLMDVFARFLEGVQHGEAKLVDFERPIERHRRHDRRCAGGKAASARLADALHRLPADLARVAPLHPGEADPRLQLAAAGGQGLRRHSRRCPRARADPRSWHPGAAHRQHPAGR